jgi:hypothetical protein
MRPILLGFVLAAVGCGAAPGGGGPDATAPADTRGPDGAPADAVAGDPTATQLLGALTTCTTVVGGPLAPDVGAAANLSICGLTGAVFWKADLDIDCDGTPSTACNAQTDPSFSASTSAVDSHGQPLDAAALPYVVVPLRSARFDFKTAGLALGSVIAVIYRDRVVYGVFGDEGPATILGEASYAMASALGIDPNPRTGGVDSGVTYLAFTGPGAKVTVMEDHAEATAVGVAHAKALLGL